MRKLAGLGAVAALVSCGVLTVGAAPAHAQTSGPCLVFLNEQDARSHGEPSDAVEVDADRRVEVIVAVEPPDLVSGARVDLEFEPLHWTVLDESFNGSTWAGSFDFGGRASYGVGLYRAVATAQLSSGGECTGAAWFRVTGRTPFTTVAGVAGTILVLVGLGLQVAGIVRGARGKGGLALALIGGVPTGAGAIILAQQFGVQAIGADSVALWVAAPAAVGGLVQRIAGRGARAPEERRFDPITGEPTATTAGPPPARAEGPPAGAESAPAERAADTVESAAPPAPAPAEPVLTGTGPPPEAAPPPKEDAALLTATSPPPGPDDDGSAAPKAGAASAPSPGAASAPPPGEGDLPRTAYARLDCPDVVVTGTEFELVVGLAATPSPDVVGDPLVRPPTSVGPYTLSVQVVADGFEMRAGESWRAQLAVTHEQPYPVVSLHLTPGVESVPVKPRSIRALFSVDGQTMGMAYRSVVVARSADLVEEAETRPQEAGIDLSVPTAWTAPDLTVRILEGESEGRLLWTFESPHEGVDLPDEPASSDLGDAGDPRSFARQIVDRVNAREGQPGLYQYLVGVGRTIADEMPQQFWDALRAVAGSAAGAAPSLLILSEEPYIPWELSVVEPPLDDGAPPFLSAQTEIGRWVLGHRRPKLPPPESAEVGSMAIISGVYDRPGWARLVDAEEEAAQLAELYGAARVNASAEEVLNCLAGTPPADLMHFAVHGIYDPAGLQDGVVLVDGHALDPMEVKGSTFTTTPFVFLNACQVGSGNKILGDHAGLAAAFLWSGACAVVAPLWSIKDTIAKGVAVRFYERAFDGAPVGTVLRNERAAFKAAEESPSATYLAYQYFGHPGMTISRGNGNGRSME